MKKLASIALAALMCVTLAFPTSANVDKVGATANNAKNTVAAAVKAPTLDGKIAANEYTEVKISKDDLYLCGSTDALLKKAEGTNFKLYASYDADYMYIGVVVDTPDYVSTAATKEKPSPIYEQHGLQLSTAKGNESTAATRSEFAITRNSSTNDLIYTSYADAYSAKFAPEGGKDFAIVTKDGVTTYEIKLPAKLFGIEKFVKGEAVKLCVTNLLSTKWGSEVCVVEYGNGCFTTKSSLQYPVLTLADAPKAATPAPATADIASIAALALAVSAAAAVVVSKKH